MKGCSCGEKSEGKLSFHHLDPSKKEDNIIEMARSSKKKLKVELSKGVVKCRNCHTIIHDRTAEEKEKFLIDQYFNGKTAGGYSKQFRAKQRLSVLEIKKHHPCLKCGESNLIVLLFHHLYNGGKCKTIGKMMGHSSMQALSDELCKTICLCQNCHENFHQTYGRWEFTPQDMEEYLGFIPSLIEIGNILDFFNISKVKELIKTGELY